MKAGRWSPIVRRYISADSHIFIAAENLMGHLVTNALTHVIRLYAKSGDPGACFNTKPKFSV